MLPSFFGGTMETEKKYFVLTRPLITEKYQEDILKKRFELCEQIYNKMNHKLYARYFEMTKTKDYRKKTDLISNCYKIIHDPKSSKDDVKKTKENLKSLLAERNELFKKNNFTKYGFYKEVIPIYKPYKQNVDSMTARNIATNLWASYEKMLFGNGKKTHYKRKDSLRSVASMDNSSGIRVSGNMVIWKGLKLKIQRNEKDLYEKEAFSCRIVYSKILRSIRKDGTWKYSVQICFEGISPCKRNLKTGEFKIVKGQGKVGIYLTSTYILVVSNQGIHKFSLAPRQTQIEDLKKSIVTKMERSRRKMNPDNFNEDGTIRHQGNKKVIWKQSNNYKKLKTKLKYIHQKEANRRKYDQECLVNEIMLLGDSFTISKINTKEIQEENGKVIHNYAPSQFVGILERKLKNQGVELQHVSISEFNYHTYNHVTGEFEKERMEVRTINNHKISKEIYAGFLLYGYKDKNIEIDEIAFQNLLKNMEIENEM